ncbi:uncharacterized mitochondrial protein AtMg01250-like [Nicotiana sylvestris]|uniref:uncharacterized mitochondrial protein AtMg01250-like n=1 Tax=Nicotiana sylvestris TaxID=4096 RepID=UPI00388C6AED
MEKAYDRMSSEFINAVMRKLGFSEKWINMIGNLISNVWYSIIINGTRNGFFTSSQGLKQGDPLSLSLFILGSEVLTRLLNKLHENEKFTLFTMPAKGPQIIHLAYADDIIIFSAGNNKMIRLIMEQIHKYKRASGQKLNANKVFSGRINRIRSTTRK